MSGISTGAALLGAAVIGAGSAAYSASEQRAAAAKAKKDRERAKATEDARIAQINRDTKPEEEGVSGEIKYGGDTDGEMGSKDDFLVARGGSTSALGAGSGSGLSSGGRQGIGFSV